MNIGDGAKIVYYRIWVSWIIWVMLMFGGLILLSGCATKLTSAHRLIAEDLGVTNEEMLVLLKKDNKKKCSKRKYTPVSQCYQKPPKPPENIVLWCAAGKIYMKSKNMKHSAKLYCHCLPRIRKGRQECKGV